jgi:HPt (histidine-containing phosphotransfer) domain-containing protein
VDPLAMDNLRGLLGDGYGHFLELFENKTAELVKTLEDAVGRGDAAAAGAAAHALKGSAGNVGASELHALAETLELTGQTGALADAGPIVERLLAVHRRVLADIACLRRGESSGGPS